MATPKKIDYPVAAGGPTIHFVADHAAVVALDAGKPGNGVAVGDIIFVQSPFSVYEVS